MRNAGLVRIPLDFTLNSSCWTVRKGEKKKLLGAVKDDGRKSPSTIFRVLPIRKYLEYIRRPIKKEMVAIDGAYIYRKDAMKKKIPYKLNKYRNVSIHNVDHSIILI